MKIYNSLTRKKEEFLPMDGTNVKMYVCGPTVYSYIHVGNARPMVVSDTLRRYFEAKGLNVEYVSNFTDVDDKIIQKANEENTTASEVSERFINEAIADYDGLNIKRAGVYPRVTGEMPEIIRMISELIEKGFAYEKNENVYYDTVKKADYGKLSGKNPSELESGARVEADQNKKNPSDFVLWKPAKPGEPFWASPWGNGRPGWHIECSCMILKYLGKTIDIHAGGEDLIFPHHENEAAQSEAANGEPLARFWMHNGMINTDDEKMSKSGGNYFLVRELAGKFGYDAIRFYILSVHYRSPVSFSIENVEAARNGLSRIRGCAASLRDIIANGENTDIQPCEGENAVLRQSRAYVESFYNNLEDDFNTANAIADIFDLVKFMNVSISRCPSKFLAAGFMERLAEMCGILGINLEADVKNTADASLIEALIDERQNARAQKNWAKSDEIRDRLANMGIEVMDTSGGAKWRYKNN